jgi:uracil-DNA glycosylase
MTIQIHPSRQTHLKDQFEQSYFSQIKDILVTEKKEGKTIYPAWINIFKAFDLTPWDKVKVVILWQDPYHGPWQAMWLSFSVPTDIPLPPSLKNIYKELYQEWFENYQHWSQLINNGKISGDLTRRAEQWVLLLNSILTVRAWEPASHSKIGRQQFTDEVIKKISQEKSHIVFLLRWNYSISKKVLIDTNKHLVLTGVHPSPLSASRWWFWCNHFTLCNDYLIHNQQSHINR